MADAERNRRVGRRTLIFIDEIHRFNKAQQDAFLPYVERGDISLIGATTENPSFEVISALLSRTKVYMLKPLTEEEILGLLRRALPVVKIGAPDELLQQIATYANGDARTALNILELAAAAAQDGQLTRQAIEDTLQRKTLLYDKSRRGAFQSDFGAPQVRSIQRRGCRALLAGPDARIRRGSHVYRAAPGAHGD